ncbi:MAG: hypothetical protein MN733_21925 [Nitrososphaera sp.]|nr:hypothetical protein [Nitrososphaera sp.]
MKRTIRADLPSVYERFLSPFLDETIPDESFATCQDCAMCARGIQTSEAHTRFFSRETKCCTYYPSIPNYLIGALLNDTDPAMKEGRTRILEKIQRRSGVSPAGVCATKYYRVLYNSAYKGCFGKSRELLCPYYEGTEGRCTVWKFREAVCSTYFCKTILGTAGKNFWRAMRAYMAHVQESLVMYVLTRLGLPDVLDLANDFNSTVPRGLSLTDLEQTLDIASYRHIWREWSERESEFFHLSYEIVRDLTPSQFHAIAGIRGEVLLNELKFIRERMINLPKVLKRCENTITKEPGESCDAGLGDNMDYALRIPRAVLDLFDGSKSVNEVRAVLSEKNVSYDEEMILSLYHHGILSRAEQVRSYT